MTFTNEELLHLAKEGDKEALDSIVQNNSGLVWSIVNRYLGRGYSKESRSATAGRFRNRRRGHGIHRGCPAGVCHRSL